MDSLVIFVAKYLFIVVILIVLSYAWKLDKKRKIHFIKVSSVAAIFSFLIAKMLARFIYDPRPFVTDHIKPLISHVADNGFPSDHTLLTMTIAAIVFIYNRKLGILLGILSLLIGTARVIAGIHHPLDILGGVLIATGATFASFLIFKYLLKSS